MSRKKISTNLNLSRARDIAGAPQRIGGAAAFVAHRIDLMTMQVDLHRGSR